MCYINEIKNKLVGLFVKFKSIIIKAIITILKFAFVIFLVGLFLFLSVWLSKYCNIQNPTEVESQEIYIFGISLENWCTWITLFGLLFTAIWSMHQYNKNKLSKQQEKASEIAKDFSNELIEKMGIVFDVLMPNIAMQKMISKIVQSKKLNQFTTIEISAILDDKDCFEKCDKIIHSKRTQSRYDKILEQRYSDVERNKFDSYFPLLVENTLNRLEAICINISSQAAGSQFIYDSLHQSFLRTIEVLSIRISSSNHNNVDKYYTNIIQVYDMWNIRKNKDIKKLNKTNKKISKLENKMEKTINNLLSKKSKTV